MRVFDAAGLHGASPDGRFRAMVSETGRMRAGVLGFAPHDVVPEHEHRDSEELFLFLSGRATFLVRGEDPVEVAAGDVVVLGAGEVHTFVVGPDPLTVLAVVAPNVRDSVPYAKP